MTIDEAIEYFQTLSKEDAEKADELQAKPVFNFCEVHRHKKNSADNKQFAEWLRDIKEAKHLIMDVSYTLDVLCNNVSCKVGCKRCTYYDEETGHCEVRKYIDKLRMFAKEVHV